LHRPAGRLNLGPLFPMQTPNPPSADYNFTELEPRWQRVWDEQKPQRALTGDARPKYYVLDMFP